MRAAAATYPVEQTGCHVVRFDNGAVTAIDRRGGSVGLVGDYGFTHAVCFAGGSLLGLEAAAGVASRLFEENERRTGFADIPLVTGAIVYDFGARSTSGYPDKALGFAAAAAARPGSVPIGRCGVGAATTVGKGGAGEREFAGVGAARGVTGGEEFLVLVALNAVGVVVDRDGTVVRGNRHADGARRRLFDDHPVASREAPPGNTTLTLVVTDGPPAGLQQLARQVHSSMARAIQPFHTPSDGDVLVVCSTGTASGAELEPTARAHVAGELAWDAVLAAARSGD